MSVKFYCRNSLLVILLSAGGFLASCESDSSPKTVGGTSSSSSSSGSSSSSSSGATLAEQVASGKAHYESMCVGCHGADGNGGNSVALTIDGMTRELLAEFIESSMPKNNAADCVDSCAVETALYIQTLFDEGTQRSAFVNMEKTLGELFNVEGDVVVLRADDSNNVWSEALSYTQRAVYMTSQDVNGESSCVIQSCISAWPPILAGELVWPSSPWSIIERADGYRQWAYDGKPLYLYSADSEGGEPQGHGVGGIWSVVFPVEENGDTNQSVAQGQDGFSY